MLSGIFGSKREEVTGDWRKLHNEQLHILYCTPDIIWVNKSRKMKWAGRVTRMGGKQKIHTEFWWGNMRER